MLEAEGYKMFKGKIKTKTGMEFEGTFLYKPEFKCWYGCGASFPADCIVIVKDEAGDQND